MRPGTVWAIGMFAGATAMMAQSASAVGRVGAVILPVEAGGYDPSRELRLSGTVEGVTRTAGGLGAELRIAYGTVRLHLGQGQNLDLKPGQAASVVVAKSTDGRGQLFLVREIQVDGQTVAVRDERGVPR